MNDGRNYEQLYNELVEVTANRIAQGHESHRPKPGHYDITGTQLELIDIIRAKMTDTEWQKFCRASALQYAFRLLDKGEMVRDADKAITYLWWLKEGKP